jgi:hypothetical protein
MLPSNTASTLFPIAAIGEVISASTTQFTAHCNQLYEPPALGAFVKIAPTVSRVDPEEEDPFEAPRPQEGALFGIVYHATTGSREPNRKPAAYGLDEASLRREQPQIFELLATEFSCVLIAHVEDGKIRSYLPPRPPRIHSQVSECSSAEVCLLAERRDYMRTLLNLPDCESCDELVAANLRLANRCRGGGDDFLVAAGKELALILRDDYDRLNVILSKLES